MGKRREERIIHNAIGDEVHIFGNDELRVKKLDPTIWLHERRAMVSAMATPVSPTSSLTEKDIMSATAGVEYHRRRSRERRPDIRPRNRRMKTTMVIIMGGDDWEEDEEYDEDEDDEE